jgi:DNA-binding CsgD family transcriptional regulator
MMSSMLYVPPIAAIRGWGSLTEAELRVVRLVSEGMANKAIAQALHLSRFTVETHLKHVFAKVGVSSRAALAAHAVRLGMQLQDT